MIDIKFLREHPGDVVRGLHAKGCAIDIDHLLDLDRQKRELQTRVEAAAAQKNAASRRIASATVDDRAQLLAELRALDAEADGARERLDVLTKELDTLIWAIPNLPAPDVRVGKDESGNEALRTVGERPAFAFSPRASWELGPLLGVFDVERAAKVSGSRFAYLTGPGVRLELALVQYALRELTQAGFIPVIPPVIIRASAMEAMGYTLHGGRQETYYLEPDDAYLVGTSEQSLGPMHMDETFPIEQLPLRYVGFSPCFRREAGSYGKDTKGIFRVHQFDKVEMFCFTTPENSDAEHERLLAIEERLLTGLGLHYQVVKMCSGDLGVPAARKYDLEAWFPSEQRFRELTSTSTCTDWQARRLRIRYRPTDGKVAFVHMLNGTAFAIGRTISAILEHYQQSDGSVRIPEVLRESFDGERIDPVSPR